MILGTDYKFADEFFNPNEDGSTVPIELLVDPFKGVVYRYTKVSFKMDDDIPRMLFDYEIIKSKDFSLMTLRKNEKFNQVIGVVLNAMLLDVADAETKDNNSNEVRDNDTQKSDTTGGIHPEGPSVPQT
jgi:hypothetical protein